MPARPKTRRDIPSRAAERESAPEVLTVLELAKLLRCGRNTIYRMVELGQVPGTIRLGRALRFSRSAVRSWLGQSTPSNGEEP